MKCYYDKTQDAVGICKNCGKALSEQFAFDLGDALACRNRCEEKVKKILENAERRESFSKISETLLLKSESFIYIMASTIPVLGIIYIFTIPENILGEGHHLFLVLGSCYILSYFLWIYRSFKISKIIKPIEEKYGKKPKKKLSSEKS